MERCWNERGRVLGHPWPPQRQPKQRCGVLQQLSLHDHALRQLDERARYGCVR